MRSLATPESSNEQVFRLAFATLIAALLLGGGTHRDLLGDLLVQICALPLLGICLWQLNWKALSAGQRYALVLMAAIVLLGLLQLLPLPFGLWRQLPGRGELAAGLELAGATLSFESISVDPYTTEQVLWELLPACAIFVAMLTLPSRERRLLCVVVLAFAALNVVLGMAQVAGGPQSPLRFYTLTNPTDAVGFFANRNHYTALLYMALPITAAWIKRVLEERATTNATPLTLIVTLLLFVLIIVGLILARSRAGLVLGMLALVGSFAIVWRKKRRGSRASRALWLAGSLGLLVGLQYGLYGLLQRFGVDPIDDTRWTFVATTARAAHAFDPIGSGFGTFEMAYQHFESVQDMLSVIVNHAHNDWVELWLEGGWAALALVAAFLAWAGYLTVNVWYRRSGEPHSSTLTKAASVGVILVLIHEFVDYSLRTTADMTVFALLCGLLCARPSSKQYTTALRHADIRTSARA